ncbi:MAG TPA: hypothetical protein VEV87_06255 [Chitinophagaceae bacterium]|nr:hypothetical protein [Chitinophagaceae bacterium]
MKKIIAVLLVVSCGIVWMACGNANARYVDLNSGEKIVVEKDAQGRLVNADDKRPVRFYVDMKTMDTIDGRTGKVVNGELVKVEDAGYEYISVREVLAGDEDFKKKTEKDGDVKIKTDDKKVKIDGKTGEKKVKSD